MQQDNYIKNKLQQLENQQLPDLSQMDEHWKQMQAALQPAGNPPAKTFPKTGTWLIAAVCIVITAVVVINKKQSVNKAESATSTISKKEDNTRPETGLAKDTTVAIATTLFPVIDSTVRMIKNPQQKPFVLQLDQNNSIIKTENKNDTPDNSLPTTETLPAISKQLLLEELFNGLVKEAQEFAIDNSKDTLLLCKEGAALFIPAGSLGNGAVKISIREYFRKSDIVMNKLTTTSNNELLQSGGMVHISATQNGQPVGLSADKPMRLILPDTSEYMKTMQLFNGQTARSKQQAEGNVDTMAAEAAMVNWIAQPSFFTSVNFKTQVWVLDLRNEPFRVKDKKKGEVAVFNIVYKPGLPREKIRQLMKEKYGYYKVRFGFGQNSFFHGKTKTFLGRNGVYSDLPIGDSVWMDKVTADKYQLPYTRSRIQRYNANLSSGINNGFSNIDDPGMIEKIDNKYGINISTLGWINCDRFYRDSRKKVDYAVNMDGQAKNYYTVIVFDNFRSIMPGYVSGDQIRFNSIPLGEPVTVISIGIDANGKAVVAMKKTSVTADPLTGLKFEPTSAPELKASLSKMDN
jgi:hypothetical protein